MSIHANKAFLASCTHTHTHAHTRWPTQQTRSCPTNTYTCESMCLNTYTPTTHTQGGLCYRRAPVLRIQHLHLGPSISIRPNSALDRRGIFRARRPRGQCLRTCDAHYQRSRSPSFGLPPKCRRQERLRHVARGSASTIPAAPVFFFNFQSPLHSTHV